MLETGNRTRDAFAHKVVFEVVTYPEIRFTLDSLVALERGDTLRGTALGTLELHGVQRQVEAALRTWPEGSGLRVRAAFQVPAKALVDEYGMSRWALGLGVTAGRWEVLHMGVDLILKPAQE
jgi:polyisoprenoid-binding protein YceI